jgi:hypothetical protein
VRKQVVTLNTAIDKGLTATHDAERKAAEAAAAAESRQRETVEMSANVRDLDSQLSVSQKTNARLTKQLDVAETRVAALTRDQVSSQPTLASIIVLALFLLSFDLLFTFDVAEIRVAALTRDHVSSMNARSSYH